MKTLLILTLLAPVLVSAGNLSALLTNPDVGLIDTGINTITPSRLSDYNVEKPPMIPGQPATHKVWSRDSGGYSLTVDTNGRNVTRVTEISRVDEDDRYLARKISLNADGSIKVLTECDSSSFIGHHLDCISATENLCAQLRTVYPNSQAMTKDVEACEKLSANFKKMEDIYTKESATKGYKDIFTADTTAIKTDFANLTNTFKIGNSLTPQNLASAQKVNAGILEIAKGKFGRIAKLCDIKQTVEQPSWFAKSARPSGTRNTSKQQGQR